MRNAETGICRGKLGANRIQATPCSTIMGAVGHRASVDLADTGFATGTAPEPVQNLLAAKLVRVASISD